MALLCLLVGPGATCERTFSGLASSYSNESGSRTASGVRFDDRLPTAAHRCLPFGTKLLTSRAGLSVVVTVNDAVRSSVGAFSTSRSRAILAGRTWRRARQRGGRQLEKSARARFRRKYTTIIVRKPTDMVAKFGLPGTQSSGRRPRP